MARPKVTATRHELPFDALTPFDFERLCLALVSSRPGYVEVEHLGAAGGDLGRDITALHRTALGVERVYVQCKRLRSSAGPAFFEAAVDRIQEAVSAGEATNPDRFELMVTQYLSDKVRKRVRDRCAALGWKVSFTGLTELDQEVGDAPRVLEKFFGLGTRPSSVGVRRLPFETVAPRHLEAVGPGFVNRTDELARLDRFATSTNAGPRLLVVKGASGSGKSRLAREWAHRHKHDFPDGHLVVDFRAIRDAPSGSVSESVRTALIALGCPAKEVPDTLPGRVSLYRTVTADRALMVVLDDVRDAAEVRALVPDSPRGLTLVTSQSSLADLVTLGGADVTVGRLAPHHARNMLQTLAGSHAETDTETAARESILAYCDGLPLAIEMCATRVRADAMGSFAWVAEDLADESTRLERISGPRSSLEVVFADSYGALSDDLARAYRLFGLAPRLSTLHQVAIVLDCTDHEARRTVGRLRARHLIEALVVDEVSAVNPHLDASAEPSRDVGVDMHDLLRLHARATSLGVEAGEGDELLLRIVTYAVARSREVDRAISPQRLRVNLEWRTAKRQAGQDGSGANPRGRGKAPASSPEPSISDGAVAGRVFEVERPFLLAAQDAAEEAGLDEAVCIIADSLWPAMSGRGHDQDLAVVYARAVSAAQRLDDDRTLCRMLMLLARGLGARDEFADALEASQRAVDAAKRIHDDWMLASALEVQGLLELEVAGPAQAIDTFKLSRSTFPPGQERGVAIQDHHIGMCQAMLGDHRAAVVSARAAKAYFDDHRDDALAVRTSARLAESLLEIGDAEQARQIALDTTQAAAHAGEHRALGRALLVLAQSEVEVARRTERLNAALAAFEAVADEAQALRVRGLLRVEGGTTTPWPDDP